MSDYGQLTLGDRVIFRRRIANGAHTERWIDGIVTEIAADYLGMIWVHLDSGERYPLAEMGFMMNLSRDDL